MIRIDVHTLGTLIGLLRKDGFKVLGPTVRDHAVVYDEVRSYEDLPIGWGDTQSNASYTLEQNQGKLLFAHAVGPHSWKQFLFQPECALVRSDRTNGSVEFRSAQEPLPSPLAFFGVRPCELRAISIQDRVFLEGPFADPWYKAVRESLFIVAVQCTHPGGTCFCASMKAGPRVSDGFDLSLTELSGGSFLVEAGSQRGSEMLTQIPWQPAEPEHLREANQLLSDAAVSMGRSLDTEGLQQILYANLMHPRWDAVGQKCLSCANCTMVCPTCFCSTVSDSSDLANAQARRTRTWDSCFTSDFSHIHGGSVRSSTRSRYRQWITHKLASWIDQFGTSGCVGCGRCITWCPVGIDLTEEARIIREQAHQTEPTSLEGT